MKNIAAGITCTQTGEEGLDRIGPLWDKLRLHHKERAPEVFKNYFNNMNFDIRKRQLHEKALRGNMLIDVATDKKTGKDIGYCVSTVSANKEAELESIYIEKEYRKQQIGDKFMKTALGWMKAHGATKKIIGVAVGNEEALGFYQKYGFYPRVHVLQQADTK
jgi:diamine N-acetyltransferase